MILPYKFKNSIISQLSLSAKKLMNSIFRRNLLFLPQSTSREANYLNVQYSYRVENECAQIKISDRSVGKLSVILKAVQESHPVLLSLEKIEFNFKEMIKIDFKNKVIEFKESADSHPFEPAVQSRRYELELTLRDYLGKTKKRTCSLYVPGGGAHSRELFSGVELFRLRNPSARRRPLYQSMDSRLDSTL